MTQHTTQALRDLIANDGYAITFQTMAQYRTALLKACDELAQQLKGSVAAWNLSTETARSLAAELVRGSESMGNDESELILEVRRPGTVEDDDGKTNERHIFAISLAEYPEEGVYPIDPADPTGGRVDTALAPGAPPAVLSEAELRAEFEHQHEGRNLKQHRLRGTYVSAPIAALWNQHKRTAIWMQSRAAAAAVAASPAGQAEGSRVIPDILAERKHQDREWGGPEHDDSHHAEDWFGFIFAQPEKYWKALDRHEKHKAPEDEDEAEQFDRAAEVRRRLVKIAALAVAGVESIDRVAMSATKGQA